MEDDFKLVRSYQYSYEAQVFCSKLESEGIDVYLRDMNTVDSNPIWSNAVGGVKLFVQIPVILTTQFQFKVST